MGVASYFTCGSRQESNAEDGSHPGNKDVTAPLEAWSHALEQQTTGLPDSWLSDSDSAPGEGMSSWRGGATLPTISVS